MNAPDQDMPALEPQLGELVRKYASRGKVHVDLEITGSDSAPDFSWNEAATSELSRRLGDFAKRSGIEFKPTPELLWQIVMEVAGVA